MLGGGALTGKNFGRIKRCSCTYDEMTSTQLVVLFAHDWEVSVWDYLTVPRLPLARLALI